MSWHRSAGILFLRHAYPLRARMLAISTQVERPTSTEKIARTPRADHGCNSSAKWRSTKSRSLGSLARRWGVLGNAMYFPEFGTGDRRRQRTDRQKEPVPVFRVGWARFRKAS